MGGAAGVSAMTREDKVRLIAEILEELTKLDSA